MIQTTHCIRPLKKKKKKPHCIHIIILLLFYCVDKLFHNPTNHDKFFQKHNKLNHDKC